MRWFNLVTASNNVWMARARMRQFNLEVNSFTRDYFHSFENRLLPSDAIMLGTLEMIMKYRERDVEAEGASKMSKSNAALAYRSSL